jgi:hypothetical protein
MKKFFLVLASAAMLFASVPVGVESADAASFGMHRHYRHHHRVCRIVKVRKVVWRHHHRHVVRYNVRRCRWV